MRNKFLVLLIGVLSVVGSLSKVWAAPTPQRDGAGGLAGCLDFRCDMNSGPVCAIDASGIPRTFENRCLAELAYCREGRYYAEVKVGEC